MLAGGVSDSFRTSKTVFRQTPLTIKRMTPLSALTRLQVTMPIATTHSDVADGFPFTDESEILFTEGRALA
jgi:hypothetical protein